MLKLILLWVAKQGSVFAALILAAALVLTVSTSYHAGASGPGNSPSPTVLTPSTGLPTIPYQLQPINTIMLAPTTQCRLIVPANPFSAAGLATPWQLAAGLAPCSEADPATAVFVQATIFSPSTGQFFVYTPLVINAGSLPAVATVIPHFPTDAVVGIWVGGNGISTQLVGDGAGACVNGTPTPFGQVAFCGASAFFAAVNATGYQAPPLGIGLDGLPCPTVRDFSIVDQDQSDNVQSVYLLANDGQTAQDNTLNRQLLDAAIPVRNPSDNSVLSLGVDKALGCKPWMVPDLTDPTGGTLATSQALDELQAAQLQPQPQAFIPAGDPMALGVLTPDLAKINQYRAGVDQPLAATLADASTAVYCVNILQVAPQKLLLDKPFFSTAISPVPAVADSLYTFMAQRLATTLGPAGLNCTGLLNITNPINMTMQGNLVIAASINGK